MSGATADAIRSLIDQVDEVCRESAITRERIERRMLRPPHWPERRHPGRWADYDHTDESIARPNGENR
jgi:hypothetical protein